MKLADLSHAALAGCLHDGLILHTPPFSFRLRSPLAHLHQALRLAYADYSIAADGAYDFDLHIAPVSGPRRWLRPLIRIEVDGARPFEVLPSAHAFPLLEWAMNWCVTSTAHHYTLCHSAVLAHRDRAVLLPAPPGSGKSTLCAALALSGWRLLSDELALIAPANLAIHPCVRPVSLKNASIAIIRERFPAARLTPEVFDTIKGTVAHLAPPALALDHAHVPARPTWVILPQYRQGATTTLQPLVRAEATAELARNCFNLVGIGTLAFDTLAGLCDTAQCYRLEYASLDEAIALFGQLAAAS